MTECFKEDDDTGSCSVKRVTLALERDFDLFDAFALHPEVTEAVALVADEDGGWAGHIDVPVHGVGVRGGCDDLDVVVI